VLVAAAALVPVLAGCEAGTNAPTQQFHYPTDTGGTAVGKLSIRNVFVLGAPLGKHLQTGNSASVFLALVNNGAPDRLVSISAPGTAPSVTLPAGGVEVRSGQPVFLSGPTPIVFLTDLSRPLTSGSDIKLVLHFLKAGPINLQVPVMPKTLQYSTLSPPPGPAPAASAVPSGHHPRVKPAPSPSAS
jgi:copper(I)-binding protein